MAWFAVYETVTGRLVSIGSVVAQPLDAGLSAVDVGSPPADTLMWDAPTRTFVPRPVKVLNDRLDDIIADVDVKAVWDTLTQARKDRLRVGLIRFLGSQRWRVQNERTTL